MDEVSNNKDDVKDQKDSIDDSLEVTDVTGNARLSSPRFRSNSLTEEINDGRVRDRFSHLRKEAIQLVLRVLFLYSGRDIVLMHLMCKVINSIPSCEIPEFRLILLWLIF
jgi:hypothetical protein